MAGQAKYAKEYRLADGTLVVSDAGLVDGRDVSVDGSKLDGVEALADVTDATNVAAAGAAMLAVAQTFTAGQLNAPTALSLAAGLITPSVAAGNEFTYSMASGAAEVQLPTGCAAGYRFTLDITSDASNALTWVAGYLWGDVTASATDMTAVGNTKHVLFECRALSATQIFVMPSEVFSP